MQSDETMIKILKKAPEKVQRIVNKYDGAVGDYKLLNKLKLELQKEGYFLDYDLNGEITEFRKIKSEVTK